GSKLSLRPVQGERTSTFLVCSRRTNRELELATNAFVVSALTKCARSPASKAEAPRKMVSYSKTLEVPGTSECPGTRSAPRDITVTPEAWDTLVQVNTFVNKTIKPLSDLEHWGMVELW